jgi:DNA-directed RNA polymerase alpha subunit
MSNAKVCDFCGSLLDGDGVSIATLDICQPCQQRPITAMLPAIEVKREARERRREERNRQFDSIREENRKWTEEAWEQHLRLQGEKLSLQAERFAEHQATLAKGEPIERLELTARTYNRLKQEGIHTIPQLADRTAGDLMEIRNFGAKCLAEVRELLAGHGLALRGEDEEQLEDEDEAS